MNGLDFSSITNWPEFSYPSAMGGYSATRTASGSGLRIQTTIPLVGAYQSISTADKGRTLTVDINVASGTASLQIMSPSNSVLLKGGIKNIGRHNAQFNYFQYCPANANEADEWSPTNSYFHHRGELVELPNGNVLAYVDAGRALFGGDYDGKVQGELLMKIFDVTAQTWGTAFDPPRYLDPDVQPGSVNRRNPAMRRGVINTDRVWAVWSEVHYPNTTVNERTNRLGTKSYAILSWSDDNGATWATPVKIAETNSDSMQGHPHLTWVVEDNYSGPHEHVWKRSDLTAWYNLASVGGPGTVDANTQWASDFVAGLSWIEESTDGHLVVPMMSWQMYRVGNDWNLWEGFADTHLMKIPLDVNGDIPATYDATNKCLTGSSFHKVITMSDYCQPLWGVDYPNDAVTRRGLGAECMFTKDANYRYAYLRAQGGHLVQMSSPIASDWESWGWDDGGGWTEGAYNVLETIDVATDLNSMHETLDGKFLMSVRNSGGRYRNCVIEFNDAALTTINHFLLLNEGYSAQSRVIQLSNGHLCVSYKTQEYGWGDSAPSGSTWLTNKPQHFLYSKHTWSEIKSGLNAITSGTGSQTLTLPIPYDAQDGSAVVIVSSLLGTADFTVSNGQMSSSYISQLPNYGPCGR